MFKSHDPVQQQAREVEAFLDGLAKQIKAFEDRTGHRIAANMIATLESRPDNVFPFGYCRAADMVCPGCGEIHNDGEAVQATFVNTFDLSRNLTPFPVTDEQRREGVLRFARGVDKNFKFGGPNAYIIENGNKEYGPDRDGSKFVGSPDNTPIPSDLGAFVEGLLSGIFGEHLRQPAPETDRDPQDPEDMPAAVRAIVDKLRASGGNVRVINLGRIDPDDDLPKGPLH